jgi:hypothetical protein
MSRKGWVGDIGGGMCMDQPSERRRRLHKRPTLHPRPARFPSQRLIPPSVGTHPSVNGMSRSRCHRNVSNRQYARQAYFKYPTRARRLQGRQYHYGEILTQRPDKCKQSFVALDNFNCSSPTSPKHTETSLLNADHASHVYLIISVQPMLSNSPARQRRWSIARYMLDS